MDTKKLYRSRVDRVIAGVCGGLGEYFGIDPVVVRLIFVLLTLGHGFGLLIYIVLAIAIPENPDQKATRTDPGEKMKEFAGGIKERAQAAADEFKSDRPDRGFNVRRLIGFIFIIVGALALANVFFPFGLLNWQIVWPLILIAAGALILLQGRNYLTSSRPEKEEAKNEASEKNEPAETPKES